MVRSGLVVVVLVVAVFAVSGWACTNLPRAIPSLPYVGASSSTVGAPKVEVACANVPAASVGHWYRYDVTTTEGQTVYATTCTEFTTFDTVLQLYESWTSECILSDPYYKPNCTTWADGTTYDTDGPCSTLSFVPVAGKTYWIYVYGYQQATGTYSLDVDKTQPLPCAASSTAVTISSTSTSFSSQYTSTGVTISPQCDLLPASSKGNWYVYTGDGNYLTVSICPNSGYDTKFTVFTPGSCNNCYCATCGPVFDDPILTSNCDTTSFLTVKGKPYYIFVTAAVLNTNAIYKATFTRSVAPPTCAAQATTLTLGSRVVSNFPITSNGFTSSCGVTQYTKGALYTFTGYSGEAFLSTCGLDTDIDTKISVFTSPVDCTTCSCLQCVTSPDVVDVSLVTDYSQYCTKKYSSRNLSIMRIANMDPTKTYYVYVYPRTSSSYGDQFGLVLVNDPTQISSANSVVMSSSLSAIILVFIAILSIIIV